MSRTRIYAVTNKPSQHGATRLIRASQAGPALNFVAKDQYHVEIASQDDLVAAIKAGVEVEDVNPPPASDDQVDVEDVGGVKSTLNAVIGHPATSVTSNGITISEPSL